MWDFAFMKKNKLSYSSWETILFFISLSFFYPKLSLRLPSKLKNREGLRDNASYIFFLFMNRRMANNQMVGHVT
jgi:hypothetical protein